MKKLLLLLLALSLCWAIRVAPGSFSTQYVPLGHPQDLGISLVCTVDRGKFVRVSVIGPDAADMPHCVGYRPLPEVEWFVVEGGDSLPTDSSGTARAKMWVDIPDRPELYNQHFVVRLFVTSPAGGMFQAAVIPYYFIETPPLAEPPVPPAGILAVAPSVVDIDPAEGVGSFVVFNNDTISHSYTLVVRRPLRHSRRFPNLSPGFVALDDTLDVQFSPEALRIDGGGRKEVSVRWREAASARSPTEAIILLTSDDGTTNFVRVKLRVGD